VNPWNTPAVIQVVGSYVTVRGLEITRAAADGVLVTGTNVVLDSLHIHHGYLSCIRFWQTTDGLVVGCTLHDTYDYGNFGGDADCLSVSGDSATFGRHTLRNNLGYNCSDDGIDTWKSAGNLLEGNVMHHNGLRPTGYGNEAHSAPYTGSQSIADANGNGNGFKLGPGGANIARNNVAYDNRARGFDSNDGGGNQVVNNTAFRNQQADFVTYTYVNTFTNNLSFPEAVQMDGLAAQSHNSWNLGIADPGFASTDPAVAGFLHLAVGSPAIDVGVDVGLPYSGVAPDLGAYEFDAGADLTPPAPPTGLIVQQ
jgi:parallel beta-helix repeat protein